MISSLPFDPKRVFTFCLASLFLLLHAWSQPAVAPKSRLLSHEMNVQGLQSNLAGHSSEKKVLVYLPPGYEEDATRRYPVIYFLHGIFDQPGVWEQYFGVPKMLDSMIEAGTLPPVLAVFPEGRNPLGGGYYRNSTVSGNWGDFVAEQLPQFIDQTYRSIAQRDSRAVIGHSMGGYGAIHLAMHKPGVFGVVYAMSPCCLAPVEDLGQGNPVWGRLEKLSSWEEVEKAVQERDFYTVAAMGLLQAFMPTPEKPPFFVTNPFRTERGEILPALPAFERWEESFPLAELASYRAELASLRGLALDYGNLDQFAHIPTGTRLLSERMAELRIPHLFEVYAGDHRQQISERLRSVVLPFAGLHLQPEE